MNLLITHKIKVQNCWGNSKRENRGNALVFSFSLFFVGLSLDTLTGKFSQSGNLERCLQRKVAWFEPSRGSQTKALTRSVGVFVSIPFVGSSPSKKPRQRLGFLFSSFPFYYPSNTSVISITQKPTKSAYVAPLW